MDERVINFSEMAKKRWEYLDNDDSTMGNKCYEELLKLAQELRDEGKLQKLDVLLDNENEGVLFETASKLLTLNLRKAEQTLERLADKKGVLPFTAKMTLKQWKAGKLKF
jgi:methionine synthase I (cobalamin-dependent)